VVFKGLIAATTAIALSASPVMAAATSPAVGARVGTEVAPATESVDGGSELRGGFAIPLIAIIAIILGLCAATDLCGGDDEDIPHSP
jgi:hypothetical protein